MAGLELPVRAIRQQIASSIHLVVQQTRFSDGSRRVQSVAEVIGIDDHGEIELRDIYSFRQDRSEFVATGYLPSFTDRLLKAGIPAGESVI
jgi:pilus assembly protein CpaF